MLVEFLFGFRYSQYEEHPTLSRRLSDHQEIAPTQSITNYKSHPPFGSLSKNQSDKQFSEWLKRKFNSLGSDGELRKFQKASNSLRRNNIDKSEMEEGSVPRDSCDIYHKIEKEKEEHMRRFEEELIIDIDDIVSKALDKQIEQLIRLRTFRKFKQALDSVMNECYVDSGTEAGPHTNSVKRRVNDDISEVSNYDDSDNSDSIDKYGDKDSEGSSEDNKIK